MEGYGDMKDKEQEPESLDYSELPPETAEQLQTAAEEKRREFEGVFGNFDRAAGKLAEQADTDPLTGFYNRRAFEREAEKLIARYRPEGSKRHTDVKPLAFFCLDIDDFKHVNDKYGHASGDEAIMAVIATLKKRFRPEEDLFGRSGGDELVIALPNLGPQDILERFGYDPEQHKDAQLPTVGLEIKGEKINITLSGGVAEYHPGDSLDEVLKRADRALYFAKITKNRVVKDEDVPTDWIPPEVEKK